MSIVHRSRPDGAPQLAAKVEPLKIGGTGVPDSGTPVPPDNGAPVVPSSGTPVPRESGTPVAPIYRKMTRMDARLRQDQVAELTQRARALSHKRISKDQRITESTLLRMAVDLLFRVADDLTGDTEAELRKSIDL